MNLIALAAWASLGSVSGTALPADHLDIAIRVAGQGLPQCTTYRSDGTASPCLPQFALRNGNQVNGWNLRGQIAFTVGATRHLNRDEFALLAGHEIAHWYLGHTQSSRANELAADQLGAELACRAGFDPVAGSRLYGHLISDRRHPAQNVRREAVLQVTCKQDSVSRNLDPLQNFAA